MTTVEPTCVQEADGLVAAWADAAAPPPEYTVSQWADAERKLPETSNARGARWRTETVPYLRGIMDVIHEPGISAACLMKGSQVGGSEALHNILGYHMHHDPCAMLMVHPTATVAEEWSKDRLSDLIRSTPALRALVRDKRAPRGSHEAESTLSFKVFPSGFLAVDGANSPNAFARWSVKRAFGDDIDRWPAVLGDEGDPVDLLRNRVESFYDSFVFYVSTPTLKGGRIDTLFQRSDQRRYFLECPMCGRWDYATWSDPKHFRVTFDDRDPETARLECPDAEHGGCAIHLFEPARRVMVERGEWRPTAVAQEPGLAGFHLPAMLSTIGARTLPGLVEKWLSARAKGKESTRVFLNTQLAEGWEERGARMDSHLLLARREDYGAEVDVPAPAAVLTAGVDVQYNRLELHVWAWGPAFERWLVDVHVIPGSPKHQETWTALLSALSRRYRHASGHQLPIHATCVDSGFSAEEVYTFVLAHQVRRIFATKGFAGRSGNPIVGKPSEVRYGKNPRPVRLYPINTDDAKAELYNALALEGAGPGRLHFPLHLDAVDEEYFAQLCAEHKVTKYNTANVATHIVWVQDRERNEALDGEILALAAFKLLNPNVRQMAAAIAATPLPTSPLDAPVTAGPEGASSAPQGSPSGRRVTRSTYLG